MWSCALIKGIALLFSRQETGLIVVYAVSKFGESPSLSLLSAGIPAVSKILDRVLI